MNNLDNNLLFLCKTSGIEYDEFLEEYDIEDAEELILADLEEIAENFEIPLAHLLFKNLSAAYTKANSAKIKLLVLDVDGVMTDGGMYFTENGDQFKKFNTKDGMGIMNLQKQDIEVCIISNGFKGESIAARAKVLGISRCYVGRSSKLEVLEGWMTDLDINFSNVAIIGDDVNDLSIIEKAGLSACPSDAVSKVLDKVTVTLSKKGGEGCVREFIDLYLMEN